MKSVLLRSDHGIVGQFLACGRHVFGVVQRCQAELVDDGICDGPGVEQTNVDIVWILQAQAAAGQRRQRACCRCSVS